MTQGEYSGCPNSQCVYRLELVLVGSQPEPCQEFEASGKRFCCSYRPYTSMTPEEIRGIIKRERKEERKSERDFFRVFHTIPLTPSSQNLNSHLEELDDFIAETGLCPSYFASELSEVHKVYQRSTKK